ncbi:MAG: hypothetical protein RMJ00_06505, partial [Nitrososphaerota archaeon]|nr:hypothetical protein [Nitrososphaerota archaeon]
MNYIDRLKDNFKAWFEGEAYTDIVLIASAPKPGYEYRWSPWDSWSIVKLFKRGRDPIEALDSFEEWILRTVFIGDGFPRFWINLGPGALAAFLGAKPIPMDDTVWFKGGFDWSYLDTLEAKPRGNYWKLADRLTVEGCRRGKERFVVGITDIGGPTDVAGILRGVDKLFIDSFRNRTKVKKLLDTVVDAWIEVYDRHSRIILSSLGVMSCWMHILYPDIGYPIQCDLSVYMSPKLFEEIGFKPLTRLCERLEYPVYHLDGPGEIPHLDRIKALPGLKAIQWTPGAGKPDVDDPCWFHLYDRILEGGLNLVLLGMKPENIVKIARRFN